jgi:hypothetical protein
MVFMIFIIKIDIMEIVKKIDLGEYVIVVRYNDEDGSLNVSIYDELEELVESVDITNSEDEDDEDPFGGLLN